jgi:xylan 1,4-beta-xylosidase
VMNVFRMFGKMSGQHLRVESDAAIPLDAMLKDGVREKPDISALASLDKNKLALLAWHYHDADLPGPDADLTISIAGIPSGKARVQRYLIDHDHTNVFTAWQKMGSPAEPTPEQYATLEKMGQLAPLELPEDVKVHDATATLSLKLPRQAVALLVIEWDATPQ